MVLTSSDEILVAPPPKTPRAPGVESPALARFGENV